MLNTVKRQTTYSFTLILRKILCVTGKWLCVLHVDLVSGQTISPGKHAHYSITRAREGQLFLEKCLVLMANRLTYMLSTDDCQTLGLRYIRIPPDTDPCPSDISSHEFWNVEIGIRNKLNVYNSNFTGQQSSR